MEESVVAIIPARGGSKGLPKKNIADLGGKPLIAWTIEAALKSPLIERVIVTTDSEDIADTAVKYGAEAPFLRPAEISGDYALTEDALYHALKWLEDNENKRYSIWVYLQPTDVFRCGGIVNKVVERLYGNTELDTVFAACPEHKNFWARKGDTFSRLTERGYLPRQKKEHIYREDTGIACATREYVIRSKRRIGERVDIVVHDTEYGFVDIHTEFDLWLAGKIITELGVDPNGE